MGLQISTRESDDVTILDLTGRLMAGPDSDLLSPPPTRARRPRCEQAAAEPDGRETVG